MLSVLVRLSVLCASASVSFYADCGLSVSWDSVEDTEDCDEFSASRIKDRRSDQGSVQQSLVGLLIYLNLRVSNHISFLSLSYWSVTHEWSNQRIYAAMALLVKPLVKICLPIFVVWIYLCSIGKYELCSECIIKWSNVLSAVSKRRGKEKMQGTSAMERAAPNATVKVCFASLGMTGGMQHPRQHIFF